MTKSEAQEKKAGLYGKLLNARVESAKVFPHNIAVYKNYVSYYQGVKLSKKSVKAIGRA